MRYWSQKQRMAEIELGTADGSDEIKVYDEVQDHLASGRYTETATKVEGSSL